MGLCGCAARFDIMYREDLDVPVHVHTRSRTLESNMSRHTCSDTACTACPQISISWPLGTCAVPIPIGTLTLAALLISNIEFEVSQLLGAGAPASIGTT